MGVEFGKDKKEGLVAVYVVKGITYGSFWQLLPVVGGCGQCWRSAGWFDDSFCQQWAVVGSFGSSTRPPGSPDDGQLAERQCQIAHHGVIKWPEDHSVGRGTRISNDVPS